MDIRIKEPLYVFHQGREYVVRQGTTGVERRKIVYFYDVTRVAAAGFSRDFCLDSPQMFQVSRVLSDKEVSVSDVMKVLKDSSISPEQYELLYERINSL